MSEHIKLGDRVRFRVGRGYAEGRVSNIADGMASITAKSGKILNRSIAALELILFSSDPAPRDERDYQTFAIETPPSAE